MRSHLLQPGMAGQEAGVRNQVDGVAIMVL